MSNKDNIKFARIQRRVFGTGIKPHDMVSGELFLRFVSEYRKYDLKQKNLIETLKGINRRLEKSNRRLRKETLRLRSDLIDATARQWVAEAADRTPVKAEEVRDGAGRPEPDTIIHHSCTLRLKAAFDSFFGQIRNFKSPF